MPRWPKCAGGALGLIGGITLLRLAQPAASTLPAPDPILPECGGALRELVIHYEPAARPVVETVYREFLAALDRDVTVHVVCPSPAAFEELSALAGPTTCRLQPLTVPHPITTWSRDRWAALGPDARGEITLLAPRGEAADGAWPARAGDELVAGDIAAGRAPDVRWQRSRLFFDAGDFMADEARVFVVGRMISRNVQRTVYDRAELERSLRAELGRPVIMLDPAPDHHAGMFMVVAGGGTVLVADPRLGRDAVENNASSQAVLATLPDGPDFTPATQQLFDAVAGQCERAGCRVVRIPVVPAADGRTFLTYVNVLLDQHGSRRVVYLPRYRGVEPLNRAAAEVWQSLGFDVRTVDCTDVFRHFGCLHCLVNVMAREG